MNLKNMYLVASSVYSVLVCTVYYVHVHYLYIFYKFYDYKIKIAS
jgi:hypothetical protein